MCECKLILCAFLVSNVILVTCFNVEQENFALYRLENNNSMFGFTVAVHRDRGNRGWVLVGAPEAQSSYQDRSRGGVFRGGAVYKCRTDTDNMCQEVPFDTTGNTMMKTHFLDEKSGQWFGATLSSSGETDGPVVACAPRYVWFTRDLNRRDPVGTCFVSNGGFDNFEEYSPCRTMNWGYHRQGSCQAGFSAAINRIPQHRTTIFENAPSFKGVQLYNKLPEEIASERNYIIFKNKLRKLLISKCYYKVDEFFNE